MTCQQDFSWLINVLNHPDAIRLPSINLRYTPKSEVRRSRAQFFHGQKDFLLYTERFHFFRRFNIRGIQNLVFYSLPQYHHFYPELLNMVADAGASCAVLYSKFDIYQLQGIVGNERASVMMSSDSLIHMFCWLLISNICGSGYSLSRGEIKRIGSLMKPLMVYCGGFTLISSVTLLEGTAVIADRSLIIFSCLEWSLPAKCCCFWWSELKFFPQV